MSLPTGYPWLREGVQKIFLSSKQANDARCEDRSSGIMLDPDAYLFAGDPELKTSSFLSTRMVTYGSGFLGFASCILKRGMGRQPFLSGIQWYAMYIGAGLCIGNYLEIKKQKLAAERDLQYLHYIHLHPEDFPPPNRVMYKDYLESWIPHR